MGQRVGVDVGGTFTDVVTVTDGDISVNKVPSTPASPDNGVMAGLQWNMITPSEVTFLAHGTTVATNAVLEGTWGDTALITTKGFRDVLEIGRQDRPSLYNLDTEKPTPIVPRNHRYTVPERLGPRGTVETPLAENALEKVTEEIAASDVESVAISLLFAYENPTHEERVATAMRAAAPDLFVSCSSTVLPEILEYERTLATSLNAALRPILARYIGRVKRGVTDLGIEAPLRLMQSNGGMVAAERAQERPIHTLLSGPAAGVRGAAHVAANAGVSDIIAMDMGGTSCDVSLVRDGEPVVSTDVTVGDYPIGVPMVDVHTIGAGGGSIAWVDAGDALRVGPQSAGATPGPISYGRGGSKPTVTDAQVVMGRIAPESFLAEDAVPDPTGARRAIETQIADPLGMDVQEAAAGIVRLADANMQQAIRVVSVERGYDPRSFALVAFGGAGPLHATAIARALDIPQVIIPKFAGVLSALGLVLTDLVQDMSTSRVREWDNVTAAMLEEQFASFAEQGVTALAEDGISRDQVRTERMLDMQYRGQSYTLSVPVPDPIDTSAMAVIADRFHERHKRRYGHASPTAPLELVTIRLRVRGAISSPDLHMTDTDSTATVTPETTRPVQFQNESIETPVLDRATLHVGTELDGPLIIEGSESTVLLHPSQRARVDSYGSLIVEATA